MAHTSFWERRNKDQRWRGGQGWEWGEQRGGQRQSGEWHQLEQMASDAPTIGSCLWVPLLQAAAQESWEPQPWAGWGPSTRAAG